LLYNISHVRLSWLVEARLACGVVGRGAALRVITQVKVALLVGLVWLVHHHA